MSLYWGEYNHVENISKADWELVWYYNAFSTNRMNTEIDQIDLYF